MRFNALHRAVGAAPTPITAALVGDAITAGVRESRDLDWKSRLPPSSRLAESDFPKDVAAMRNAGGGVIVYGVTEEDRAATGREDTGPLTEGHERSLRASAARAVTPPIFDLQFDVVTFDDQTHAVVLEIPAGIDSPHMITRNDYFGAPVRNDADTLWMSERALESAYRARFTGRDEAAAGLARLYDDIVFSLGSPNAHLVGVARPRVRPSRPPASRDDVGRIFREASYFLAGGFESAPNTLTTNTADLQNPRTGLRRWIAHPHAGRTGQRDQASAAVHHDGSITHWASAGGFHLGNTGMAPDNHVHVIRIERFASAVFALVRASAEYYGASLYEVRVGIVNPNGGLRIATVDNFGHPFYPEVPEIRQYVPVDAEIRPDLPEDDYAQQLQTFALDLVNQGGVEYLQTL